MTDELRRRRVVLTMLAVFIPVVALSAGRRIAVALGLTAGFAAVLGVAAVVVRYRPEWTDGGPGQDLDLDDRRRVAHAVRSGEAAGVRLARAVAYRSRWIVGLPSLPVEHHDKSGARPVSTSSPSTSAASA